MSLKSEKTPATMLRQYGEIFYKILYFREMSNFWILLKAFALAKATMIKISQKMRMRYIKIYSLILKFNFKMRVKTIKIEKR